MLPLPREGPEWREVRGLALLEQNAPQPVGEWCQTSNICDFLRETHAVAWVACVVWSVLHPGGGFYLAGSCPCRANDLTLGPLLVHRAAVCEW